MRTIKTLKESEIPKFLENFTKTVTERYNGNYDKQEVLDMGNSACKSIFQYSDEISCNNNKTSVIAAHINQIEVYGLAKVITHKEYGEVFSLELSQIGAFGGAGKELFQYILETAYQKGFEYVWWNIASRDENLKKFYKSAAETKDKNYSGTLKIDDTPATFTFCR